MVFGVGFGDLCEQPRAHAERAAPLFADCTHRIVLSVQERVLAYCF